MELYNLGIWIWITSPNSTWRTSLLDQQPFKEYQRLKGRELDVMMKKNKKYNLECEVRAALRAMKKVAESMGFYIAAGAQKVGLHPFAEELDELHHADCFGVDITGSTNNKAQPKKKKTETVHTVHQYGGWLHDPRILELLEERDRREEEKMERKRKKKGKRKRKRKGNKENEDMRKRKRRKQK